MVKNKRLIAYIIVLFPIFFGPLANAQQPSILRIAVASNFSPALEQVLTEFTKDTQIKTQLISSATGVLFQQIKHGAPFDVFLSADSQRPQQLSNDNLIVENSLHTYAYGQIALWSASESVISLAVLQKNKARLAIANPDIAPYGKAAKEFLVNIGLWPIYQKKLITGHNVNQTFQQLQSQAAALGIVAYSQLILNNLTGFLIPQEYYQPIKQQLVIIKNSKNIVDAQKFSAFIRSEAIQKKLVKLGYKSIIDLASVEKNNMNADTSK